MFPWNYGFHFGIASYIFLGAFYTVLVVVATTLLNALWRAHRDLRGFEYCGVLCRGFGFKLFRDSKDGGIEFSWPRTRQ